MRAAQAMLAQGKQAIVLVPEISLTPQTIRRFAARFPGRVSVIPQQARRGRAVRRLAPGPCGQSGRDRRRALGAVCALARLGLIVLDEEHETSYKQDSDDSPSGQPLYHARDVAVQLGKLTGASVILGSATPSLETYLPRAARRVYTA